MAPTTRQQEDLLVQDNGKGDVNGENIHSFGGIWHTVAASTRAPTPAPTPSPTPVPYP